MNIIGSLFGSLNTAGSLSRSTVQAVSGGKTQVPLIITILLLLYNYLVSWIFVFYNYINCSGSSWEFI